MVGTLRREILDRTLVVNTRHLLGILDAYATHYNQHRPHQSRQQLPPETTTLPVRAISDLDARRISRHPVLGNLINEYHHVA
jgi:putative transposase